MLKAEGFYQYRLPVTVFLSGAVVMVLEIVGSRVLAPFLGTSIYTWTALIGIILASLSLGYWWGGKLADKNATFERLSTLLSYSGISILVLNLLKRVVLATIYILVNDLRVSSTLAALTLFAIPSVLLGMISPLAVKLKLTKLDASAETVGTLYALSTAGSIFGTFIAGFVLLSYLGTTNVLFVLSLVLFLLAWLNCAKSGKIVGILILVIFWGSTLRLDRSGSWGGGLFKGFFKDVDTAYNRVWIFDAEENFDPEGTQRKDTVRYMRLGDQMSSAMYLNSNDLVFGYLNFYRLSEHFKPGFKETLLLGGAAYTYPKWYLREYPEATIDVVEIDPELFPLAEEYFGVQKDPRMSVIHKDARVFLNDNSKRYDVVFGDVFSSGKSVPFQLATVETAQAVSESLVDDGVYIINVISALEGPGSQFLRAEYTTLTSVFSKVYVFPVHWMDLDRVQNVVVVAVKAANSAPLVSADLLLNGFLSQRYPSEYLENALPPMVDEYAPVERYTLELCKKVT